MRKRKRIGYGTLDWIDNRNSQIWLQNKFLRTIEKLEPEKEKKPLRDLAEQPFEEFVNFHEKQDRKSILRRRRVSERLETPSGRLSYFSLLDEDDPLRKAIWQWGETYHLNSDWCYEMALQSLNDWYQFKSRIGKCFESLPFYGHPDYLGFGSLAMVYNMASMPRDSLSEEQKKLVDSFNKQQFIESFDEQQRAFLSVYTFDPHITDDESFFSQVKELIEMGLPPVNPALPVLNLLSPIDRDKLRRLLFKRATELWERLKQIAEENHSVKLLELGANEVSKHLEWAVRYQVFEERYYSIEGNKYEHQCDKQKAYANVRKETLKIIKLVDLKPRTALKGRSRSRN